ncbi:MAG: phosphoribosylformylglycinamidine synthase subunit PurL [Chloroflexi bacterium]|nr:phosphoribosylformylglycinamidine synthase subunit PurL [Chloroflexota bacterium]
MPRLPEDPRSAGFLHDAHALGLTAVERIRCADLYFIQGRLTPAEVQVLAGRLLHDPITHTVMQLESAADRLPAADSVPQGEYIIEVALRPGVTDPVAEQIVRAARLLGISGVQAASTGLRFEISGAGLSEADCHLLAARLLSNPIIQRYTLGAIEPSFPLPAQASDAVEVLPVCALDESGLLALSQERRAALDLTEMRAVQAYCRAEDRDLTDVEFEMIAQTWSEHCVHKTFKAQISVERPGQAEPEIIPNLFRATIRAATEAVNAPWVLSAFVDNAGLVEYDGVNALSFKVETHNHPSAIEPFGGANTGVGGVIRDVLGVSAKPVAATDVLCFGPQDTPFEAPPAGVLHPRRILSGVVAGVQDYGNKIGLPTVSGGLWFDPGYTANPLVFCGCLGIAPKGKHPRQPLPGDRIIVLGGRTGRDGLRGATFSSMTMDAQTGEVSGASVQIGAPVVEKGLIDVVLQARDADLYHAITDCGAGGLSSAVGEMTSTLGGRVQLERVPLKYAGLAPWEIWLSEAQERMVLAVPPESLPALHTLCDRFAVELTDIGAFEASGRIVVRYAEKTVLDLSNDFLHEGLPQRKLSARVLPPRCPAGQTAPLPVHDHDYAANLLALLSHPNIASKERVIRLYDHEVQGGTLVKPLAGLAADAPADAVVLRPPTSAGKAALALSAGMNPEYGKLDARQMALNAIDEAVRNAVAAGANPDQVALLDNFCWGDPLRPETLGELVEAARGCYDGAVYFGAPFISGKDSFNNEYLGADGLRHAIPPTLLISGLGLLEDGSAALSMDLKSAGNLLYMAGAFEPTFGGSHYALVCPPDRCPPDEGVPALHPRAREVYRALHAAARRGLLAACHDLSEGGLAVAAAEMCIGGWLGLALDLEGGDPLRALFGETTGCLLVEVPPQHAADFEAALDGLPCCRLGTVTAETRLAVQNAGHTLLDLPVEALREAFQWPF